jgi:pimeloyl-ACP methyl ester carboxylesterase
VNNFERAGLVFDVVDSGPAEGPPVILLHGFPGNPRSWERVTPTLVEAGYRVLVPAQRGYSPGARPPRRRDYRVGQLVEDVIALADQAGLGRFAVAGHDWGAPVAWGLAARYPERLTAMAALSVPHPGAFRQALAGTQALRSWYMAFFQLPALPERILLSPFSVTLLERSGLDAELAADYVAGLRGPGACRAALNWYRALPLEAKAADLPGPIQVPTLFVWSTKDPFLGRRGAERCGDWVRGPYRFELIEGASHWLPETEAHRVGPLLVDHLANHP